MDEISPQNPKPRTDTDTEISSKGRWVNIYSDLHGSVKRPIYPRYTKQTCGDTAHIIIEQLLRQISGREELNTLILLVSPTSKNNSNHKLHCFDKQTYSHLGTTRITSNEMNLMRQYQMLIKYDMMFTNEYLAMKSLARYPSNIADLLHSNKIGLLIKADQEQQQEIKSLREPKFPVRLRQVDIKCHGKNLNTAKEGGEPVWKI